MERGPDTDRAASAAWTYEMPILWVAVLQVNGTGVRVGCLAGSLDRLDGGRQRLSGAGQHDAIDVDPTWRT